VDTLLSKRNELALIALAKSHFSPNIYPAELRILQNSVREGPAQTHPNDRDIARHVRGSFLRWILNDQATTSLLDKDGLQVASAIIDGDVDLDSSEIQRNLTFDDCVFSMGIHFNSAKIRTLRIWNSTVNGPIVFDNTEIGGDIDLGHGVKAGSYISAFGAQISGDVLMQGAQLLWPYHQLRPSLALDTVDIKGSVNLSNLACEGSVSILGARIANGLIASGATFKSIVKMTGTAIGVDLNISSIQATLQKLPSDEPAGTSSAGINLNRVTVGGSIYLSGSNLRCEPGSLSLQNAVVAGNVFLTEKLRASGTVDMSGAEIKQTLYVEESSLFDLNTSGAQIGKLLVLLTEIKTLQSSGAQIGEFGWAGIPNPRQTTLDLSQTHIKTFKDEQNSWPGHLKIIGLVYDDIALEVPKDLRATATGKPTEQGEANLDDRIAWLHLQSDQDLVAPQPWMQLAQYVQSLGNPAGSKKILYEMKRIRGWREGFWTGFKTSVPDYIDVNPWRITYFIGLLWLFGSVIFWRARRMNEKAMAPREKGAYDDFSKDGARPQNVPPFNPIVYTLENVLPVVKFGQDDAWGPNPQLEPSSRENWKRLLPSFSYRWLAFARMVLIILGWALALILAGVIGDLFKS
jgi:hypothetical protein